MLRAKFAFSIPPSHLVCFCQQVENLVKNVECIQCSPHLAEMCLSLKYDKLQFFFSKTNIDLVVGSIVPSMQLVGKPRFRVLLDRKEVMEEGKELLPFLIAVSFQ